MSWRALETYSLSTPKAEEQENFDMPRIANLGDFDWDMNPLGNLGHWYCLEHLCLRLILDTRIQNKPSHRRDFEVVTFCGPRHGITPGYNTKFQYDNDLSGEGIHYNVFEEDTRMMPSLIRELGRFIAKELPSVFVVSAICKDGDLRKIRYIINQIDKVEYPTRFINSLVRKVNRWAKENRFDIFPFPPFSVDYQYMVNCGTCVRTIRTEIDPEELERLVLRLRRVTCQKVDWGRFKDAEDNKAPHYRIYATCNNVGFVQNELNKILGVQS